MWGTMLQVAAGGALGAGGRYLVNHLATRSFGVSFPMGTLIVNIVGSFLMGVLVVVLARRGGMHYAPFLMTGVLGGFTTFSAFSLDVSVLYERGDFGLTALYTIVSVAGAVAALFAGLAFARGVVS